MWNNIDITETNKTIYNVYRSTKAHGFLPSLFTEQRQQMQVQSPQQLASSLPYSKKLWNSWGMQDAFEQAAM